MRYIFQQNIEQVAAQYDGAMTWADIAAAIAAQKAQRVHERLRSLLSGYTLTELSQAAEVVDRELLKCSTTSLTTPPVPASVKRKGKR